MIGNIIMGKNSISSELDPKLFTDFDLTRKQYVDDGFNKKLSLTGGTMTCDINIGNHKIISTYHKPTHET